jgi:quinol monooxygenase YgiN
MYLRVTRSQFDPARSGDIAPFATDIITAIQKIPGCLGVEHAMDRTTGRAVTISRWPTEEHATATAPREHLAELIARLNDAGLALEPSEIYEVVS